MSDNNRIAKNTLFLYLRLFISMIISFYSSRILLKELGVEDYGIYNVVGSLVAIFSSLKGFLTSSTQRFLNFEMGRGNLAMVSKVFNMSIVVHLLIACLFLLLIETVGLWFLFKVLVIPDVRFNTALWVFQLSAFTIVVSIMTVPYDSVLIANERMNIFALLSIFDNLLKLGSVVLLFFFKGDKLLYYALFVLLSSIIVRLISARYCRKNFEECVYRFDWDKNLFRKMASFAGWQFLGNSSFAIQNQGLNMVLNVYFGPLLNAARGIAMQANMAIQSFIQNMMIAINPQLTKKYGANDLEGFFDLFYRASKYSFCLFSVLSFPVFLFTEELLKFWLGNIPEYVVVFLRLLIIYSLIRVFHNPIDSLFKAYGNIKEYQILDSLILVLSLPLTIILYKLGYPPQSMYLSMIFIELINLVTILCLAKKNVGLDLKVYSFRVLIPCIVVIISSIVLGNSYFYWLKNEYVWFNFFTVGSFCLIHILVILSFSLDKAERGFVISKILRKK